MGARSPAVVLGDRINMSDDNRNDRVQQMMETLPSNWDKRPVLLAEEIAAFLKSIKDEGTGIDSGTDGESGDLWVTVQGIEYWINIRKSNSQLVKEGKLLLPSNA
jgi:hypothetical protein